ncbi:unnamed protein product [Cunninghamella blakesleeana]
MFHIFFSYSEADTSFSVSRYSRGINAKEYYQIITQLDMMNLFKSSLLTLTPQKAILALQEILPNVQQSHYSIFLPFYLKIMHCLPIEKSFIKSAELFYSFLSSDNLDISTIQQLLAIILSIYRSNNITTYQCIGYYKILNHLYQSSTSSINQYFQSTVNYLFELIHKNHQDVLIANSLIKLNIQRHQSPSLTLSTKSNMHELLYLDILSTWKQQHTQTISINKSHQLAFQLIYKEIQNNCLPSKTVDYLIDHQYIQDLNSVDTWIQSCQLLLTELILMKPFISDETTYSCMFMCLSHLKSMSGSYESVLKAMIQYIDLWVIILKKSETLNSFAQLIFISKQWNTLYSSIKKAIHVFNAHGDSYVHSDDIMILSSLLKIILNNMCINDLLHFRDETFMDNGHRNDDLTLPATLKLWDHDDEAELVKCCNQFVRNDSDQIMEVEPKLLQQVIKLSFLWPFEVLRRLVLLGLGSKGQYNVVVPILQQMGDLCMLRQHENDLTLLARVILSIVDENPNIDESFISFINACCFGRLKFNSSLFLEPREYFLSGSSIILLHIWELLNVCLIPRLRYTPFFFDNGQEDDLSETRLKDQSLLKVKTALQILQSLTNDNSISASIWYHQLQTPSRHCPLILSSIDIYSLLHHLTIIMDQRYKQNNNNNKINIDIVNNNDSNTTKNSHHISLDISDLTNAYDVGRKFMMVVRAHLGQSSINHDDDSITTKPLLNAIDSIKQFYEASHNYDWRSYLFWYEMFTIVFDRNSLPIYLPSKVIDILNDITSSTNIDHLDHQQQKHSQNLWIAIDRSDSEKSETNDVINPESWGLLLNGCQISNKLSDELFKISDFQTPIGWLHHPNEEASTYLQTYFIQCLHPYQTIATHYEYQSLLNHFLSKLYDHIKGNDLMLHYNYSPSELIQYVKLLNTADCKKYYIILHSINLLKRHKEMKDSLSTLTMEEKTNGEIFFLTGIIQVIQSLNNWQHPCGDTSTIVQDIRTTNIRTIIKDPVLKEKNCIDLPTLDNTEEEVEENNETLDTTKTRKNNKSIKIVDCYYPWYDQTILSSRALSLITFQLICSVSSTCIEKETYDKTLRVLLLQIVEGLADRYTRNLYLVQKANITKKAFAKWKRDTKMNRVRLHLRPILKRDEMDWVVKSLNLLTYEDDSDAILNSFTFINANNKPLHTYY